MDFPPEDDEMTRSFMSYGFKVAAFVKEEKMKRVLEVVSMLSYDFPVLAKQFVAIDVDDGDVVRMKFGRTKEDASDSRALVEEADARAKEKGLNASLEWKEVAKDDVVRSEMSWMLPGKE